MLFRKRASVIIEDSYGYFTLYTKGADSTIFDRMDKSGSNFVDETTKNLS
jgi:magnesium-transporting ATPase (P-type)